MQCAYCSQRASRDMLSVSESHANCHVLPQNIPSYLTVQSCWPNLFHCLQMELVFELACISMHTLYCMMHKEIEKMSYPGSQTILTSSLWSLVFLHTAIDQRLEVGIYWEQGWSWASYHETISQHVTRDCSINILFSEKYICTQLEMQDLSAGVWLYPYSDPCHPTAL